MNESNTSFNLGPIPDVISLSLKFWLFLIILIPSIICSVVVLFHMLHVRSLRRALGNHPLIISLIIGLTCELTIYPWMLRFYFLNNQWQREHFHCVLWGFIDWGLYSTQTILFAWTSIERHILIFHEKWLITRKQRFFLHYLPLTSILVYSLLFYLMMFFFPPCKNAQHQEAPSCVDICVYQYYWITIWDTVGNQIVPNMIIVFCCVTLFIRVIWKRHRIHRSIRWKKYRKMAVQILTISLLYLCFSFPNVVLYLLLENGIDINQNGLLKKSAEFSSYFIVLLFPFICLFFLPDIQTKLRHLVRPRVHPSVIRV